MARYTQDSIERLRESADIVALISRKTDLRRVGSRWTGLCPFHEERTPSFSVDPERGLYHCFGCGVGGDAIRFVMETEQLDFPGAVELLAEDNNVELKRERRTPRRSSAGTGASGCWRCSSGPRCSTPPYSGTRPRPAARATTCASAGCRSRCWPTSASGYAPKAWDPLLTGAAARASPRRS